MKKLLLTMLLAGALIIDPTCFDQCLSSGSGYVFCQEKCSTRSQDYAPKTKTYQSDDGTMRVRVLTPAELMNNALKPWGQ